MMIINIKPSELAKHAIEIESHSGWSLNLIAPFTRKELEKKTEAVSKYVTTKKYFEIISAFSISFCNDSDED